MGSDNSFETNSFETAGRTTRLTCVSSHSSFFCYILAYLDRVNVGFAKLQMLESLVSERCGFRHRRWNLLYRLFLL